MGWDAIPQPPICDRSDQLGNTLYHQNVMTNVYITKALYHEHFISHEFYITQTLCHRKLYMTQTSYHKSSLSPTVYITKLYIAKTVDNIKINCWGLRLGIILIL